MNTYGVTIGFE